MSKRMKDTWKDERGILRWVGKKLSHGTYRKDRKPNSKLVK